MEDKDVAVEAKDTAVVDTSAVKEAEMEEEEDDTLVLVEVVIEAVASIAK